MKRAGKLFAHALLSQCQLRCKPAQLKCPSFQFGMTLFQLSMTSADCLLSLLLEGPLSFFIAAGLESLLGVAAFRDVQVDPSHPGELPVGDAVGAAQAVHPPYGPIRSYRTEYDVPVILMPLQHVFEVGEHFREVVLVNTGDPCVECLWGSLGEAVLRMESVVPTGLIRERIPRPGARHRGVQSEPQPLFSFLQHLFGLYKLGNVDIVRDHPHQLTVFVVIWPSPGSDPPNVAGREKDSELDVEGLMIMNGGVGCGFDLGQI